MIDTLLRAADPAAGLVPDPDSADAQALLAGVLAGPRAGTRTVHRHATRRTTRRLVLGGVLAGAVATVLLVVPMPWDHGGAGLGSSAYAVTSDGGTVRVTVRWAELSDPSALQAALDRAGARTRVFVETGSGFCAPKARSVGYRSGAVDWHIPRDAGAEDGIVLHPDLFPPDGTFVLVVGLAQAGSTATPASTFGPGGPALTGTLSFMAEGPVSPPDC